MGSGVAGSRHVDFNEEKTEGIRQERDVRGREFGGSRRV